MQEYLLVNELFGKFAYTKSLFEQGKALCLQRSIEKKRQVTNSPLELLLEKDSKFKRISRHARMVQEILEGSERERLSQNLTGSALTILLTFRLGAQKSPSPSRFRLTFTVLRTFLQQCRYWLRVNKERVAREYLRTKLVEGLNSSESSKTPDLTRFVRMGRFLETFVQVHGAATPVTAAKTANDKREQK